MPPHPRTSRTPVIPGTDAATGGSTGTLVTASSMADSIAIGLRALAFIAALQAAGASLFLSLFAEDLEHAGAAVRSFAGRTAAAAALIVVAHQLVEPARLTGDLSGV